VATVTRYRRRSARVILIDGEGRVLLFRGRLMPDDGYAWFTPGGGVDDGETLPVAAARELFEETGLAVRPEDLGAPVAYREGWADLGFAAGRFRDDFFVYRVAEHTVDISGFEELEAGMITEYRWWTPTEVATAAEPVYPIGLADLLTKLPPEPVELPWHH
jgi:8-oxo-dGTP pyrophosphatase MutT (NUDIX family)